MKHKNSTNLKQVYGGTVIKQNDTQSVFSYELLDESYNRIEAVNGRTATIILVHHEDNMLKIAYEATETVENGKVTFRITEKLEPKTYVVEIRCGGYIFASDNKMKITVTKTAFSELVQEDVHDIPQHNFELKTVEENIDYMTEYIDDNNLYIGNEVVERQGQDGIRLLTIHGESIEKEEVISEPITEIIRRGTKLYEHVAYANISKSEMINKDWYFVDDSYATLERNGNNQIVREKPGNVTWAYVSISESGNYEVSIRAKRLTEEKTDISFGFENIQQIHSVENVTDEFVTYTFVANVNIPNPQVIYHLRFNNAIEIENFSIKKINFSDLSQVDSGQNSVGIMYSQNQQQELDFKLYDWKLRG